MCVWPQAYTWVLRQDPLGLLSQAIHILNKYDDPFHLYNSPWPSGVPGGPPSTVTPITMGQWVYEHFYADPVGIHMYNVPVIGVDHRASSLRTNQFAILATLLGYRYLIPGWQELADWFMAILRSSQIGGFDQPTNGCWKQGGDYNWLRRNKYFGAQMYVWDQVSVGSSQSGSGGVLGIVDFNWLRNFINFYFNLPPDDGDHILSTVETTATFAQACRVYAYHRYGILIGDSSSIPGY